ncbi:MAG: RsmE family RNA methyltransferase, partial [Ignavibacteriaceae bacterium]|nr:RsmE family RNA methyltransferase [Ignavibacteriaceae bacterium]
SAMKQSLNPFLSSISISKDLKIFQNGENIPLIFDQFGDENIPDLVFEQNKKYILIFGPEGGLTSEEIFLISSKKIKLTQNRLRSETAIISVASFIALSSTKHTV